MKFPLLPFIAFLLASTTLPAQVCDGPGGMRHISVKEGLPSTEVYSVIQDRQGYIWMSTDAGVCRYNGYAFESFTTRDGLDNNTVFHLVEDKDGRIWAMNFSGALNWFDGKKFNSIGANDSLRLIYANGQRLVQVVETDAAGGIITGGLYTGGVYRVGPEDNFAHLHRLKSLASDSAIRTTWSVPGKKAYTYVPSYPDVRNTDGSFLHNGHLVTLQLISTVPSPTNSRVIVTADNRLLYSFGHYLYEIDANGHTREFNFPTQIVGLNTDKDNNLWVSCYYGGTWLCPNGDPAGRRQNFLYGHTVSGVFQDNELGYWFSTVGDGMYYVANLAFGYLTRAEGLPENIITAMAPVGKHAIVLGMPNNTMAVLNPQKEDADRLVLNEDRGRVQLSVEAIYTFNDTILVSGVNQLYMDTLLRTIMTLPVMGHAKGAAMNTKKNVPFFFSHAGFFWFSSNTKIDSLQPTAVRFTAACYGKDGTLWLGALNGLWKYENGRPVYAGDSLHSGIQYRIDGICEDSTGLLWIATRGEGVFAFDGKNKWHFGEEEGMASTTCRVIRVDRGGRIWVGTNHGVTMISAFDRRTGKATLRSFNSTHGLLSDEIRQLVCQDGKLWMGTSEGVCWIPLDALIRPSGAPPVYIKDVLYGQQQLDPAVLADLHYSNNAIRVFVEGIYYHDPSGLRYRYRLIGGNGEWITTENREITFAGLSPGDYSLEIVAVNSDGIASARPAVFSFHIEAPYWRTWWFITGVGLILLALVWLLAGNRARKLRRRAAEKAETDRRIVELRLSALRAQMNPHFIFNAINSIQHFVLRNDGDQAYHYLSKFSRLIRMVLEQSQSDLIPIDQELQMLNLYIELEQLRFERPFRFSVDVDPVLLDESARIPGMLVQPFVENAIWHGLLPKKEGDAWVKVKFSRTGDEELYILVEDNGVGRKGASETKTGNSEHRSYGLKITEERLKLTVQQAEEQPVTVITDLFDDNGKPRGTRIEVWVQLSGMKET